VAAGRNIRTAAEDRLRRGRIQERQEFKSTQRAERLKIKKLALGGLVANSAVFSSLFPPGAHDSERSARLFPSELRNFWFPKCVAGLETVEYMSL
jgi:hypothetical protein